MGLIKYRKSLTDSRKFQLDIVVIAFIGSIVAGIIGTAFGGFIVHRVTFDDSPLVQTAWLSENQYEGFDLLLQVSNFKDNPASKVRVLYYFEDDPNITKSAANIPTLYKTDPQTASVDVDWIERKILSEIEKNLSTSNETIDFLYSRSLKSNIKEQLIISDPKDYKIIVETYCSNCGVGDIIGSKNYLDYYPTIRCHRDDGRYYCEITSLSYRHY